MSSAPKKPWFITGLSKAAAQNAIGEVIYTRVHPMHPKVAGKITGMFLEDKTIAELDALLDDADGFNALVAQAVDVLKKAGVAVS
jgi:hypothetical protein